MTGSFADCLRVPVRTMVHRQQAVTERSLDYHGRAQGQLMGE